MITTCISELRTQCHCKNCSEHNECLSRGYCEEGYWGDSCMFYNVLQTIPDYQTTVLATNSSSFSNKSLVITPRVNHLNSHELILKSVSQNSNSTWKKNQCSSNSWISVLLTTYKCISMVLVDSRVSLQCGVPDGGSRSSTIQLSKWVSTHMTMSWLSWNVMFLCW